MLSHLLVHLPPLPLRSQIALFSMPRLTSGINFHFHLNTSFTSLCLPQSILLFSTFPIHHPEPVEAPPVPPGRGGLTYAWGLMLRDLALLLVNTVTDQRKTYIFFRKCAPTRTIFKAQHALNIVWRPGFARTRSGSLQRSPDS